jgi:hypothetical protein
VNILNFMLVPVIHRIFIKSDGPEYHFVYIINNLNIVENGDYYNHIHREDL